MKIEMSILSSKKKEKENSDVNSIQNSHGGGA